MAALDGNVKVPLLKKPVPKRTAYLMGAGVVVVVGVALYKRHKASTAAATAATTTSTTDTSNIDPATGYPYGSAEDANALSQQAAYYQSGGSDSSNSGQTTVGNVISTNDQWDQAAISFLVNTVGLDSSTVSSALGDYLNGNPVVQGSAEDSIITQAIAAVGQPPVAGANGYPPSIKHTTAGGGTGQGGGYSTSTADGFYYMQSTNVGYQVASGKLYTFTGAQWSALNAKNAPPHADVNASWAGFQLPHGTGNPPAVSTSGSTGGSYSTSVANGYYYEQSTNVGYEVYNGKRYTFTGAAWSALNKPGSAPPHADVNASWPGFKLPAGTGTPPKL